MAGKTGVGIVGCGTIGGFVLDALMRGKIPHAEARMVCGRSENSRGRPQARDYAVPWTTEPLALLERGVDVVVEAASHEALEKFGVALLKGGADLIPASLGALVDGELLRRLIDAAVQGGSRLHIPSGGIGGLDALRAYMQAGVQRVCMTTRKPPAAWKGIPCVERMQLDLERMQVPALLYSGPARDCVREFPQNINIAAALSLAGVGFEKTQINIWADPHVRYNTHEIECEGDAGRFFMRLENVPVPENPKTTYLACLSVVAALENTRACYRVGT